MRVAELFLACLVVPATLFSTAACSSSTEKSTAEDAGSTCEPYTSTADLSQPVAFQKDVMPLLHANCGGCHRGGGNGTPNSLTLGPAPDAGVEPLAILQKLVNTKSVEDPDMDLVAPGDPANSYLIHKIDGDQCTLASACNAGPLGSKFSDCGGPMPPVMPAGSPVKLPAATRDIVRAWIHQGAKSD
jgi:hypothetical protein